MSRNDPTWTDARVAALTDLWTDGKSAREVAQALGVTRNAVIGKAHRLGLSGRAQPARPRPPVSRPRRAAPRPKRASPPPGTSTALPAPRPTAVASAVELPAQATLETLALAACRWPVGDPKSAGFGFCGRVAARGPYCVAHGAQAYQGRGPGVRRRA